MTYENYMKLKCVHKQFYWNTAMLIYVVSMAAFTLQ